MCKLNTEECEVVLSDLTDIVIDLYPKNKEDGVSYNVRAYYVEETSTYYVSLNKDIWNGDPDDDESEYETHPLLEEYFDDISEMFRKIAEYVDFGKRHLPL